MWACCHIWPTAQTSHPPPVWGGLKIGIRNKNEFAKGFESRLQLGYDAGERERIKIDSLRRKNNVDPLVSTNWTYRKGLIGSDIALLFLTMYDINHIYLFYNIIYKYVLCTLPST